MQYKQVLKSFFLVSLMFGLVANGTVAFAANSNPNSRTAGLSIAEDLKSGGQGTEYVAGKYPGAVMMTVNVWGGVRQPGIYHVPINTDLVSMISYAGGPTTMAELDGTRIKRVADSKEVSIKIDVEDLIASKQGAENPALRLNDIVVVPETKPSVHQNTMLVLTALATLGSIAVAAVVISNSRK